MAKIKEASSFGLTWDGFWLKSNGTDGYVSISSDKDFEVIRYKKDSEGNIEKAEGKPVPISIIQIGRLQENSSEYYGIRINDLNGSTVMETNQYG
jgi:hypothetical protein